MKAQDTAQFRLGSPIRYLGSKLTMMKPIREALHATGAEMLVDVFGGSGTVTMHAGFAKRVYNDIDGDLVCLFRVIADRDQSEQLKEIMHRMPLSRQIFEEDHAIYVRGCLSFRLVEDPVDRAFKVLYRGALAFAGKFRSGGFAISGYNRPKIKEVTRWNSVRDQFDSFCEFWRETPIEHQDFRDLIHRYGRRREAVLFCDPPYMVDRVYYSSGTFTSGDLAFLEHELTAAATPAVVTLDESDVVKDIFHVDRWDREIMTGLKNNQRFTPGVKRQKYNHLLLTKKQGAHWAGPLKELA